MATVAFSSPVVQLVTEKFIQPTLQQNVDETVHLTIQELERKGQNTRYVNDPDFALGLHYGHEGYVDYEYGKVYTLEEIMQFIRDELSREIYKNAMIFYAMQGLQPFSYAYCVGFIYGWLQAVIEENTLPVLASPQRILHPHVSLWDEG